MTEPERTPDQRAGELVTAIKAGHPLSDVDRHDMLALMGRMHARGTDAETMADEERAARTGIEREANALAVIVADLLDGAQINDVVDDLPHHARRRVLAYRHQGMPGMLGAAKPRDQFGPLPTVPPRAAVMRDRVRTYTPTEGPTDART